jgi:hypothetical protein
MVQKMGEYGKLHERYLAVLTQRERVASERVKSEAEELWSGA